MDPCGGSPGGGCQGNSVPSSPLPFYACVPACQESNTQKIIINQFAQALKVANSWNIPACGFSATLSIPGLVSITIGSYLWSESYGYFEVTAFDSGLQQVTILNHCNTGNAAVGTAVPACSEFINTAPPAPEVDSNTACVKIDFTAPANGNCIDITLTTTSGVSAGDTVQIGTGFYRVDDVKPNDIITICNDGEGITPGTSVIALTSIGEYQYCLTIISVSPCDRDAVTNGPIIVCNSTGQPSTLIIPQDGWIPEGTSPQGTNAVGTIPLGLEPFCTRLTAPLAITNGNASYTLYVNDSTGYTTNDVLIIAGYPAITGLPKTRLTVTGTPTGTSLTGTISPVPGANVTMPTGTQVCRIGCCELVDDRVSALDAVVQASLCEPPLFRLNIGSYVYNVPVTVDESYYYFEAVIDADVIPVDISGADCLSGYYAAKATLSVASNADFGMSPASTSEIGTVYHEIEASWSVGNVNTRTGGKIVYTDVLGDSKVISGFPVVPEATFSYLPALAPNFPLNYHQGTIEALAILPPGTTATTLGLSYRTIVGDYENEGMTVFTQTSFLISGWVDIYRING
jgi:hypothetical protein